MRLGERRRDSALLVKGLAAFPAHESLSFNLGIRAQLRQVHALVSERA